MKISPVSFANKPILANSQQSLRTKFALGVDTVSFGTSDRNLPPGLVSNPFGANCTSMFRDGVHHWLNFARLLDENFKDKDRVNVVCQACSDGSEPYTIAISLMEALGNDAAGKFFPIEAGDIDELNIKLAKSGLINITDDEIERMARAISPDVFEKYFEPADEKMEIEGDNYASKTKTYRVKDILRDKVVFERKSVDEKLRELKDESNTVLLFRNAIKMYDPAYRLDLFKEFGKKLKSGSLLYMGNMDSNGSFGFSRFLSHSGLEEDLKEYGNFQNVEHKDHKGLYKKS